MEVLVEVLPAGLDEELELPPVEPPPPPPQAVSIDTAMTAARAVAAIRLDNLIIGFLLYVISEADPTRLCKPILPPPV